MEATEAAGMKTATPEKGNRHARSHDNHPSPEIRREQRPRV